MAGVVVGVALAAAAAVAGVWLTGGFSSSASTGAHGHTGPTSTTQGSPTTSPSTGATSPSAGSTPSSGASNVVTASPGAASNPKEPSVIAFLGEYFTSINTRNYHKFFGLLGAQAQADISPQRFRRGYRSTRDSNETLQSLSTAANGDTVAAVTFTSHQNPADSVNQQESCTRWQVTLWLASTGGGYVIDQPPPGYHAQDSPCP
ncbi:MAG TPA: hypothetical protein VGS19_27655 [Streptosporangiaceae bacterium]|nr:hypothetical protein [Streptosporangiaceae bacterium]